MPSPNLHNANILASFQTLTFSNVPEHVEPTWLAVDQGELPHWLIGTMYRVGGGRFNLGDETECNKKGNHGGAHYTVRHAFDGLPFIYRFEFNGKNNTLRFNSRYIAKDFEKNLLERNGKGALWFGESRKMSTWERLKDFACRFDQLVLRVKSPSPSSMSLGITTSPNYPLPSSWPASSAGHLALVTKSDQNALQRLDHDTLEPLSVFTYGDYHKKLDGQLAAAHHQYDYDTNETINMTMDLTIKPTIQVFSIDSKGTTTVLATIQHGLDANKTPIRPFYYHSFFVTKHYVVIPVAPLYYKNYGLDFLLNGSVLGGLEWQPETPTYFHVIDRLHGKGHVATLLGPSYFAFHTVNAVDYQDVDGNIVFELDCAAYDGKMVYETHAFGNITRASDYDKYVAAEHAHHQPGNVKMNNGIAYPPGHCNAFGDYRRYTLIWNPATTTNDTLASVETLCANFDFPRINPVYTFKQHRYVYGCQVQNPTKHRGERYSLVKVDVLQRTVLTYEFHDDNGYMCSEPIFVPRPTDDQTTQQEDDGVVMSLVNVYDNRGSQYDHCYLLVLDGTTFEQLTQIYIGQYIAPTFHGSYVDKYSFTSGSFN